MSSIYAFPYINFSSYVAYFYEATDIALETLPPVLFIFNFPVFIIIGTFISNIWVGVLFYSMCRLNPNLTSSFSISNPKLRVT